MAKKLGSTSECLENSLSSMCLFNSKRWMSWLSLAEYWSNTSFHSSLEFQKIRPFWNQKRQKQVSVYWMRQFDYQIYEGLSRPKSGGASPLFASRLLAPPLFNEGEDIQTGTIPPYPGFDDSDRSFAFGFKLCPFILGTTLDDLCRLIFWWNIVRCSWRGRRKNLNWPLSLLFDRHFPDKSITQNDRLKSLLYYISSESISPLLSIKSEGW